jgi:hypothetical protein
MYTTLDIGGTRNRISGTPSFGWRGDTSEIERGAMKTPFPRRVAYRILRWWREMIEDLQCTEDCVDTVAHRLHLVAGRAHVLEMEAYGETKPRKTLLPPSTPPSC